MKKRTLIGIPFLVLITLIATLLVLDHLRTPAWKVKLNHYISFLREAGHPSYHVESYTSATQPANFTPGMSVETFSDDLLFQTSFSPSTSFSAELEPMPYPPEQVICALLHNGEQLQLVYVALHTSLYNADWIVHVSPDPWDSLAIQSNLSLLGCSLAS
jgi:hypothetical protein